MYEPGTTLVLKEPRSSEDKPFPYDRVEVIGPSPVNHSSMQSAWTGADGQGVVIRPLTEFGSNLDEPVGKIQELYRVESIPEHVVPMNVQVKVITPGTAGPSPEEVFKEKGRAPVETKPVRKPRRSDPLAASNE